MDKGSYVSAEWNKVYQKLKERGYSLDKIDSKIDTQFRRNVYQNLNMNLTSFRKLEQLLGREIPHKIIPRYEVFNLKPSTCLAECIGIILGDGCITRKQVIITLNGIKEKEYIRYTKKLLEQSFGTEIKHRFTKNIGTQRLVCDKMGIVEELTRLGLEKGDKVKNQVSVPSWIEENKTFTIACIKGLFDTDGSVYFANRKSNGTRTICAKFTNKSRPLLDFFASFCENYGIKISPNSFDWQIQSRDGVYRFYEIVQPEKITRFLQNHLLDKNDLKKVIKMD